MIVRKLLTLIGYQVDPKSEQRAKKGFDRVRNAANKLGLTLSVGAVALGFKKAIDAASDVEETMNVVTTAFEDQADAVLQWAKDSGEAAGRSQFAMREYAATLGAVVGPTLGNADATAELSTNMAQLAVDLGSFFNATDEDALDAIRAGLIGSQEPLLRFGVNMSVAALDAFALEQGLGKTTKQMTAAEKTMLRYRFILARTTKAQGDAEKTSDGFANQTKRLWGNIRDIAVALGKEFLPAAANALQGINAFAKAIKGPLVAAVRLLTAPIKLLVALITGLVFAFTELSTVGKVVFLGLTAGAVALLVVFKKLAIAQLLVFGKFLLIGAAIVLAILIIEDLWQALTGGNSVIGNLIGEFRRWLTETDSILMAIGALFANAFDFYAEKIFGIADATAKVGDMISQSFTAAMEVVKAGFKTASDFILFVLLEISGFFSDKLQPVVDAVMGVMLRLVGLASDFGLGDLAQRFGLAGPSSIAAPGSPLAQRNVNANQDVNININAPNGDAQAIGNATGAAVNQAGANFVRRTSQQLLAGGMTQ